MQRRALRIVLPVLTAASMLFTGILAGGAQAIPALPVVPLPLPIGPEPGAEGAAPQPEPSSDPTSAPAPAAAPQADGWSERIVILTNGERARAGCGALIVDDRLTRAAQGHAEDMATRNEMSHIGSDGSTFDQRVRAAGYEKPGAENIARGYPDPETTIQKWMSSPGHRKNLLNCAYVAIGVGYDPRGNFVAQEFGRPL